MRQEEECQPALESVQGPGSKHTEEPVLLPHTRLAKLPELKNA